MSLGCEKITGILKDCSNAIGGIDQRIWINDSSNVDWELYVSSSVGGSRVMGAGGSSNPDTFQIVDLDLVNSADAFEVIEFRRNLATLTEDYTSADDGAVMFESTLTIPIHGRDVAKSRKITTIAAGQRTVDIIVPQNDGGYVYLREAVLMSVGDGTGATKADGSKYTLTFTAQQEHMSYFIDPDLIADLI